MWQYFWPHTVYRHDQPLTFSILAYDHANNFKANKIKGPLTVIQYQS